MCIVSVHELEKVGIIFFLIIWPTWKTMQQSAKYISNCCSTETSDLLVSDADFDSSLSEEPRCFSFTKILRLELWVWWGNDVIWTYNSSSILEQKVLCHLCWQTFRKPFASPTWSNILTWSICSDDPSGQTLFHSLTYAFLCVRNTGLYATSVRW